MRTLILDSQISVSSLSEELASRAIERTVAERRDEYVQEIQRILDATYRVIERTDQVDPSLRDILKEAKLSTQGFYRYFQSKDELLLLLLDDGRSRLLSYLEHRMDRATTAEGRVRAWVEGVLAQASRADAASRTRPFLTHQDRLAEAFPEEQQRSVDALVDQLAEAVQDLRPGRRAETARRDAEA
ncbi:MAG: TetR family transcriptional regulator, partial [Actinomycetia bacterium]|nr:TetR family transcriptional regulator [Actinomycetes bacterium]